MVILSPESVAKDIEVSDADAQAYFDSHKADSPARDTPIGPGGGGAERGGRQGARRRLARRGGLGRGAAQAAAAGASAVELDDTTQAAFPAPDLAAAVFARRARGRRRPATGAGGWAVFRVTKAEPAGQQPFEASRRR